MALKPTIYKAKICLSDLNRNYFETLNLTLALHPSETLERMMARLLAFCFNAQEGLSFTTGLSTPDQPDIIARDLNDTIREWIEVGEPAPESIKKATRIAKQVKIYSFNAKSKVWWEQNKSKFNALNVSVYRFDNAQIQALAKMVERSMEFSITMSEDTAYVSAANSQCDVNWVSLQHSVLTLNQIPSPPTRNR